MRVWLPPQKSKTKLSYKKEIAKLSRWPDANSILTSNSMPLCILCQLYWCTLQIFNRKIAKVVICDWDTTKINRHFPQLKHKISTQIHLDDPPPSYKSPSTKLIQRQVSANTSHPIESKSNYKSPITNQQSAISYQLSAKGYRSFKHAVQNAKGPKPHKLELWPLSRAN